MKKTKKKRYMIDARKLIVLRGNKPELFIINDGSAVVCLECGVKGKQPLYLKHKPTCRYVAYYKAYDALDKAVEGRGK